MRLPRLPIIRCTRAAERLASDRRAATAVEYGLIVALIVIAMVASFQLVANSTIGMWGNVHDKVSAATGK